MSENLQLRRAVFLLDTQFIRHAFAYIDSMHQNPIQQGMYNPRVYNTYVEFITRMEKLGVHVICIVPMRRKITAELLSLYQALPEGHKIDMSAHPDIDLLGTARYWFDGGHLNSDGAEIYTRLLAESFANIAQ